MVNESTLELMSDATTRKIIHMIFTRATLSYTNIREVNFGNERPNPSLLTGARHSGQRTTGDSRAKAQA